MVREIITIGNPVLNQKSKPVKIFDSSIKKLVDDMFDSMYAANGIGLAAVQIGELLRIFVVDVPEQEGQPMVLINPVITQQSHDKIDYNEGCLSLPGFNYYIQRPRSIIMEYQDLDGNPQSYAASGLMSVCLQHEFDHLEGVLFIENAPDSERKKLNKLLEKENLPAYFNS